MLQATKNVSDIGTLSEPVQIPAAFTLSLWLRTTEAASGFLVCASTTAYPSGAGVSIKLNTNGSGVMFGGAFAANKVRIDIYDDAGSHRYCEFTNAGLYDGNLHQLVVWHDSNVVKAWVDGSAQAITVVSQTIGSLIEATVDAIDLWGASYAFPSTQATVSAAIAELALFDRALTDDEVAAMADGFSPLLLSPLPLRMTRLLAGDDRDEIGESTWGLSLVTEVDHPPMIDPAGPVNEQRADMSRRYEVYAKSGTRALPGVDAPVLVLPRSARGANLGGLAYTPNVTEFIDVVAVSAQGRSTGNPFASCPVSGAGAPSLAPAVVGSLAASPLSGGRVQVQWSYAETNPIAMAATFEITLDPIGLAGQAPVVLSVPNTGQGLFTVEVGPLLSGLWYCRVRSIGSLGARQDSVQGVHVRADATAPATTVPPLEAV